jgi:hypothetical protein
MEDIDTGSAERLRALQTRVRTRRAAIRSPEAIKTSVVLPFIAALGYDPFDPHEVSAGHIQDGVKVDYAIRDGEDMRILVMLNSSPDGLASDRGRLLMEAALKLNAPCAILTNGFSYQVHGRNEEGLDAEPLLVVDLDSPRDVDPEGIEHLAPLSFDIPALAAGAEERRSREAILQAVGDELSDPSEIFANAIAARLETAGRKRPDTLLETIQRLTSPLANSVGGALVQATVEVDGVQTPVTGVAVDENAMNAEELMGFTILRAMAARSIDPERIVARPAKSYVAILLDDNNRRQIARIHFKTQSVKYLGTMVGDNRETRVKVSNPAELFSHEAAILARLEELLTPASMAETG